MTHLRSTLRRIALLTLPVIALAGCKQLGSGGDAAMVIPTVADGQLSMDLMKEATQKLSSDAFEGRAPSTPGEEKTVAYLVELFQQAGLKPGNGDSWFQEVPMVELTANNMSALNIAGPATSAIAPMNFAYGKDFVVGSYQVKPQISIKDSELVFVGYGINSPEKGWNDYAGVDVKGKTVVILVNDPDYATEGLEGDFGGRKMTYYGRWTYKFEEAARQGAAAALIVHDTFPAAYGWDVVESSWAGPQQLAKTADDGASQTMANGWIQNMVASSILAAAGQDLATLSAAAKQKGFKAVPLGLAMNLGFENTIRRSNSKNVIGILPGAKRPDEVVLYTAHWDHLGRCKADETGDDICNGAIDNATGTAALATLAKAHAAAGAADRSMVFIALTAEESGLLGSQYYAQNPVFPLVKTVGGVNMDALSLAGPSKDVTVVGIGKSQLDLFLEAALKASGRVATAESTPEKGFYYRSDHFPLAKAGLPMIYMEGGEDLLTGGKAAGAAFAKAYTENNYHAPSDEYDPNWNWDGVTADLQLYFRVGRMLGMSTSWPNWNESDEFRKARDASRVASAN